MDIDEAVKWYSTHRGIYEAISEKVSDIIKEVLDDEKIEYYTITKRAKKIDSFREKASNEKYNDPKEIKDLAGIRVITYVESEARKAADIIEKLFEIDLENSIDKSKVLGVDKVGYRSLHYIAKFPSERCKLPEFKKFLGFEFEIQIRTVLQHAWAEIEHDRNYKYSGVLPEDIKRRFAIIAGVLELADKEFDQISLAINSYKNIIAEKTIAGDLDIAINTTALTEFLTNKFDTAINAGLRPNFLGSDKTIIKELYSFDIKTLRELDEIIPTDFEKKIIELIKRGHEPSFLALVRQLMIIKDKDRYFETAWNGKFDSLSRTTEEILQMYDLNVKELAEKYNLNLADD